MTELSAAHTAPSTAQSPVLSRLLAPTRWLSIAFAGLFTLLGSSASMAQFTATTGLGEQAEFLPVEEAYQALPQLDASGLLVDWKIAPGYYLYQERFKLKLEQNGIASSAEFEWPEGKRKYDDYFEKELTVYYHQVTLRNAGLKFDPSKDFTLQLESQGCADAGLCYPPRQQRYQFNAASGDFVEVAAINMSAAQAPTITPAQAGDSTTLLAALLFALLGGAILNLMPCVFPVLSIKALSLAASGQDNRHRQLHGWAYSAGVVLSFVAIAALLLLVRAGGEAIGWGFQLQSPALVLSLAYLFFILAMALLGLVEIGARLANTGSELANKGGLKGSFFTGALATLVASPCTAPFMGSALGYAMTQSTATNLLVFAALGFGMALPFLILCYSPQLNRLLPKPGAWMNTFKQFLAFPLFLTAIWLLWVYGNQTSNQQLALALCGLLALSFGLWLWQLGGTAARVIAIASVLTALYVPFNKQPAEQGWIDYKPATLAQLRSQGKPVFVNVTADWCLTCLANEKLVFGRQETLLDIVDADLQLVKADWTRYNPEITELLAQYRRNGVPLYLMFPASADGEVEILPQLLTVSSFQEALKRAVSDK